MTEAEVIESVREALASTGTVTAHTLRLVEAGLQQFPASAALWILRGDLIQLGSDDLSSSLNESLSSYRAALEHDPRSADAHESIGRFLDAVYDSPAEAESYLRKALELGGGRSAEEALARVLEQLARTHGSEESAG